MRASSSNSARLLAILSVAVLVGCTQPEADLPGTWRPVGTNDQNLRAMLVNPQDAYVGTSAQTARGDSGARAVTRLLTDRRRSLLDVAVSKIGGGASAPNDAPLPSGGGGSGGGGSAQ